MARNSLEKRLRLASRLFPHRWRRIGVEVEDPHLSFFYNSHGAYWGAQVGSRYAGYFHAEAEIPIFYPRHFDTLEELVDHILFMLT